MFAKSTLGIYKDFVWDYKFYVVPPELLAVVYNVLPINIMLPEA
jgi:hypothetical protein